MTAVFLNALFLAAGLLAASTIISSWLRHGPAFRNLRANLLACDAWRDVHVKVREVTVRSTATVLPLKPATGFATRPLRPSIAAA
jgi:hypothetical protein